MAATLLIADDDNTIRTVLGRALTRCGFRVRTTAHASTLWHWAESGEGDLIITDVMMPDGDGLELVPSLRRIRPDVKVIVISAQNSLTTSIKAREASVYAYLPKPFDLKELTNAVNAALSEPEEAPLPVHAIRPDAEPVNDFPLAGKSKPMKNLFRAMGRLVSANSGQGRNRASLSPALLSPALLNPVLLIGESGSGKSLAAQTLHDFSGHDGTLLEISALAGPDQLAALTARPDQSALSGPLSGPLCDPLDGRATLVINSLEALEGQGQARLLAYLDRRTAAVEGTPGARLICCATPHLLSRVKEGATKGGFRRDLYDRLAVIRLKIPALRDRTEDIPELVEHFQNKLGSQLVFPPEGIEFLKSKAWPGNVRQLENLVRRLSVLTGGGRVSADALAAAFDEQSTGGPGMPFYTGPPETGPGDVDRAMEILVSHYLSKNKAPPVAETKGAETDRTETGDLHRRMLMSMEKPLISQVLAACGNNQLKAAGMLGLNRNTLRKKIKELNIEVRKKGVKTADPKMKSKAEDHGA